MKISCIVAVAEENIIGDSETNQIPWYLPADLKYFKKITTGNAIIMGRKCFESIGRALPNRLNIVITSNPFFIAQNCLIAHNIQEAIELAEKHNYSEAFIIGGGIIYEATQNLWQKLYITRVDACVKGDVFFPHIKHQDWVQIHSETHLPDEKNEFRYSFEQYIKK